MCQYGLVYGLHHDLANLVEYCPENLRGEPCITRIIHRYKRDPDAACCKCTLNKVLLDRARGDVLAQAFQLAEPTLTNKDTHVLPQDLYVAFRTETSISDVFEAHLNHSTSLTAITDSSDIFIRFQAMSSKGGNKLSGRKERTLPIHPRDRYFSSLRRPPGESSINHSQNSSNLLWRDNPHVGAGSSSSTLGNMMPIYEDEDGDVVMEDSPQDDKVPSPEDHYPPSSCTSPKFSGPKRQKNTHVDSDNYVDNYVDKYVDQYADNSNDAEEPCQLGYDNGHRYIDNSFSGGRRSHRVDRTTQDSDNSQNSYTGSKVNSAASSSMGVEVGSVNGSVHEGDPDILMGARILINMKRS